MPVKARIAKDRRPVVTERMVDLYARGVEIVEAGDDEEWKEDGADRWDEFFEIDVELQSLLGRRPWQCTVFDVALDGGPPPHMQNEVDDYAGAQALRRELQRALAARLRGRAARARRDAAPATTDA